MFVSHNQLHMNGFSDVYVLVDSPGSTALHYKSCETRATIKELKNSRAALANEFLSCICFC